MSLTISIRFLTGRAHLHHWQAHHSDGKVDWPPAPWRLLRAIVAVAGRGLTSLPHFDDDGNVSDAEVDEVPLTRLAALLAALSPIPQIWLPKTSGGHTRQFFPIHEGGIVKNSGSAVFDTFAVVRKDQPLLVHWPDVSLDHPDQRRGDLNRILNRMTYFGRAESWCLAEASSAQPELLDGITLGGTHWRCVCIEDGGQPNGREYRDYSLERKLASLPLEGNGPELLRDEACRLLPRTKKSDPKRPGSQDFVRILSGDPSEQLLLRCLLRESGQDMKDGLDRPVGSRWVHYAVPRAVYDLPRPNRPRPPRRAECVQVVRYVVNTAAVNRPVLPPLTDTLLVADKFRSAALALHGAGHADGNRPHPENLLGREEDGSLCQGGAHGFFWPTDEDNDGFIDHVTVYCPRGFEPHEVDALRRLCRIRQRGGRPDLLVTPVYVGDADRFRPWSPLDRDGSDRRTSVFVSATPYFCPVHLSHGRGRSGRVRPITSTVVKSLLLQGVISDDRDVEGIQEIVFDYAHDELATIVAAVAEQRAAEPIPPRQYFPVIAPPASYPPLPRPIGVALRAFAGVSLKNPDDGFPFGLSVGLLANEGTRFIRALSFCSRRKHHQAKGFGRMLRIEFRAPRAPKPFAIGDHCHFGLGLFVPADR